MINRFRRPMTRRDALQVGAAGLIAVPALVRRAVAQPTCAQSPAQTAGPFWVDERLNRQDIRSDPTSGKVEAGLLLHLAINVSEIQDGACAPAADYWVDVWQCNALGIYSDVEQQVGKEFLRGYQVTDAHGNVRFITIYPGYYPGRTPHIHFRVRKFDGNNVTFNFVSQLYFDDAVTDGIFAREAPYNQRPARQTRNGNDGIYNPVLEVRLSDNTAHSLASYNVVINDSPGLGAATPTDEHSIEHLHDFGGGTPRFA